MPNEILVKHGTARTWAASGGDEVLTLTSLATVTGRKGDGHDWGATFPRLFRVQLKVEFGTGPTSGTVVSVYWASSHDNSQFDANLAAGDGAASDTDVHRQLHFVGNMVCDNVTTVQVQSWLFMMPGRYGFPVVYNATGQSTSSDNADNSLVIIALIDEVQ
jgi:hypothetical protein